MLPPPVLVRLRHLGLAQNHVRTPREWTPAAGRVVALASLDLTENGLTEDGVAHGLRPCRASGSWPG